jgi:hypothetical protein
MTHSSEILVKKLAATNVLDRHSFDGDPDPDSTFHSDADPDPDPKRILPLVSHMLENRNLVFTFIHNRAS